MKFKVVAIWSLTLALGLFFASAAAEAQKQVGKPIEGPKSVIGPRNLFLAQGADALFSGDYEAGVELTRKGLAVAQGRVEKKSGLTNLCAGYFMMGKFEPALDACNEVLELDPNFWRGYNNRALVLMELGRYEESGADIERSCNARGRSSSMPLTRSNPRS
jgi:tetratricopeptide (TPR) repeat protein